jgi:hypothetical protein
MCDETALRRPDFLGGVAIRLADGRDWVLPGPPPPGPINGKLDRDYMACVEAVRDAEDEFERLRAELALTILLLARNYDLGPDDYQALLTFPSSRVERLAVPGALHDLADAHVRRIGPRRC